jgi:hypothetical protein
MITVGKWCPNDDIRTATVAIDQDGVGGERGRIQGDARTLTERLDPPCPFRREPMPHCSCPKRRCRRQICGGGQQRGRWFAPGKPLSPIRQPRPHPCRQEGLLPACIIGVLHRQRRQGCCRFAGQERGIMSCHLLQQRAHRAIVDGNVVDTEQ